MFSQSVPRLLPLSPRERQVLFDCLWSVSRRLGLQTLGRWRVRRAESLHSRAGTHLLARRYTDDEIQSIFIRKVSSTWSIHGFGDFGLALLPATIPPPAPPATWTYSQLPSSLDLSDISWVGYLTIRNALITSIKEFVVSSLGGAAAFPPWEEMIEIKLVSARLQNSSGLLLVTTADMGSMRVCGERASLRRP